MISLAEYNQGSDGPSRLHDECTLAMEALAVTVGCSGGAYDGSSVAGTVTSICEQSQSRVPDVVGGVEPEKAPAADAARPTGLNALIMRGDHCETCERAYYDGSCACPADTRSVELRGFHKDVVYGERDVGCFGGGFSFLFCTAMDVATNASDPRSVSFFDGIPASEGGSGARVARLENISAPGHGERALLLTQCTVRHASTGECSCPDAMIPRPTLLPQPTDDKTGLVVRTVVFCAPAETTVHILNAETGACFNPLGVALSCD